MARTNFPLGDAIRREHEACEGGHADDFAVEMVARERARQEREDGDRLDAARGVLIAFAITVTIVVAVVGICLAVA